MLTILIADDNKQIVEILTRYAQSAGYRVERAYDGQAALDALEGTNVDLVLLDVMMPKIDGFEVCRRIRRDSNLPVIMITARGEDFERIMGLEIGADDYIVKPFSPGEVMARVKAVLRRVGGTERAEQPAVLQYNDLIVNLDAYLVTVGGEKINLSKREIELLWTLCGKPDQVFTREVLLSSLWGYDYFGDSRTVDSHIKRLRKKLAQVEHPTWEVKTIWGVGYKFERLEQI
ncbi:MAG: response regulator transcription factor [Oscillospiraceae bacterium]